MAQIGTSKPGEWDAALFFHKSNRDRTQADDFKPHTIVANSEPVTLRPAAWDQSRKPGRIVAHEIEP